MNSNQSAWIVGYILIAFFIYITIKGELPVYAGLLLLSPSSGGNAQSQTTSSANTIIQGAITSLAGG